MASREVLIHSPARIEWGSVIFHHVTQNKAQFEPYEFFIPVIFHLLFQTQLTMDNESTDQGGLLYLG